MTAIRATNRRHAALVNASLLLTINTTVEAVL